MLPENGISAWEIHLTIDTAGFFIMDVNTGAPHEFLGMLQLLNIDDLRNPAGRAGWTDFPSGASLELASAWLAADTAAGFPVALSLPALLELCRQARADVEAIKEAHRCTAYTSFHVGQFFQKKLDHENISRHWTVSACGVSRRGSLG